MDTSKYTQWFGFDTENDADGRVTLTSLVSEDGGVDVWEGRGHFHNWCIKQKQPVLVYCHNLEYDLVNEFHSHYPYMDDLLYLKGRLIGARCGKVQFYDSANHYRMPLADVGEAMGIKKLKLDIHSKEYVSTDARITVVCMARARDFVARMGGRLGATSGSSSMSIWKARVEDPVWLPGAVDTPAYREGYYGGRVEIFRQESSSMVYGFDVNSMYPFVMKDWYPRQDLVKDDPTMKGFKGMANVTVSVPQDNFVAPLPYRDPNGRLSYPVGVFRGTWTYDEIRNAIMNFGAKVIKVHWGVGAGQAQCSPIFKGYIEEMYNRRLASKDASEKLFLKIMMNSLYGKLAARSEVDQVCWWQDVRLKMSKAKAENDKGSLWYDPDLTMVGVDRCIITMKKPTPDTVNVLWGSMVTASARVVLSNYARLVPPEKLMYCDTDSVYCEDHQLPVSDKLGGLKLEKKEEGMLVIQPKVYSHGDTFKAKGVPKFEKDADGNIVRNIAKEFIENGEAVFKAPVRFRESLRRKGVFANQWINKSKKISTKYSAKTLSKGRFFPPVLGIQLDLFPVGNKTKTIQGRKVRVTA